MSLVKDELVEVAQKDEAGTIFFYPQTYSSSSLYSVLFPCVQAGGW